ncbi:glutaredoxin 3 [Acidihalobacter yilgarnensis]|uniref:Glutaredoxin n=1 Tax=Acidihalobacter yilgarnensis TaxID=2819280 RepID=A0A1D8IRV0_9GAMM|nr:glutaredoxin 3 [Acidihalobacter yilgarnensis]AOU99268.1 glutaredoxin 3 [Acidihalobacter yilgarnensis]
MSAVVLYTTEYCPYCVAARGLLERKGAIYEERRIEGRHDLRTEMEVRSGRTSVPQIFIGDRHIGGYDEMATLDRRGELDPLLGDLAAD